MVSVLILGIIIFIFDLIVRKYNPSSNELDKEKSNSMLYFGILAIIIGLLYIFMDLGIIPSE